MISQQPDEPLTSDANVNATVLVVDDEECVLSTARHALTRCGYRVIEARDLEEALNKFGNADPKVDVVVLDMVLPGGGPNIFRELRTILPDIPVVISSGFMGQDSETVTQLLSEGRVDLLPKPYELEELYRVVDAALSDR